MNGEQDEEPQPTAGGVGGETSPSHLRVVCGPLEPAPTAAPTVRLRREFKGLTVADLARDDIVRRLPGQVQSALEHIERGDLGAAERALPGHFGKLLAGPGHSSRSRWGAVVTLAVLAVVSAAALVLWLFRLVGN